jgi:hypothetical protein
MYKYYLLIPFILFSTGQAFALPDCPEYGRKNNCFGAYTWPSGGKYVGEFKDGQKHGQGTETLASGDQYVGEFRKDEYHGQGTYTYASGSKYVGEFRKNKYHGQGTHTWAGGEFKGDKYVGQWKDDKPHGQARRPERLTHVPCANCRQ